MDATGLFVALMIALYLVAAVALVRRVRQRRAAWRSGLTAPGRVVRAWETTEMISTVATRTRWYAYEFTARDGRTVRFEESGGPRERAVGDEILVHYAAREPERATASAPQPGRDIAGTAIALASLAVVTGVIVLLAVT
ncbi:DUF3592 domain-containing protein [Streptomyces sp. NPDC002623]